MKLPAVIVAMDLSVASTTIRAQCPHCAQPILIHGEHPAAKIEISAIEPKGEKDGER